jgi:hypothetical protein
LWRREELGVLVGEVQPLLLEGLLDVEQLKAQQAQRQRGGELLALQQQELQSHHRIRGRLLPVSKPHHASTGCRRHFSTVDCRGQSASCQKLRLSQQLKQSQPKRPLRTTRRLI